MKLGMAKDAGCTLGLGSPLAYVAAIVEYTGLLT